MKTRALLAAAALALAACGGQGNDPADAFGLDERGPWCQNADLSPSWDVEALTESGEAVPVHHRMCLWACGSDRAEAVQMVWTDDGSGWRALHDHPVVSACP